MGLSGAWNQKYKQTYPGTGTAAVWGTGINPVHAYHDDVGRGNNTDPERQLISDVSHDPDFIEYAAPWGYNPEDIAGLDVFSDDAFATIGQSFNSDGRPVPGDDDGTRKYIPQQASRPLGISGRFVRALRGGPHTEGQYRGISSEIPTETVSEGWVNKPASGFNEGEVADSQDSDPSQHIIKTSQVQRYKQQENVRAVMRGEDPRSAIKSRVVPMKIKQYSEGERHYDMTPQRIDDMPRPFTYRTAATGPVDYLNANEMYDINALQRTPPPDPSQGTPDTEIDNQAYSYGYVAEDTGYY